MTLYARLQIQIELPWKWERMNNLRTNRISLYAFIGVFFMFGLAGCVDKVYAETGNELTLRKTVSPLSVSLPGQVITYTYEVKNNTLKNSANYLSAMTIVVTDSPLDGPVVCNDTSLDPEESTICTATYTVTENDIANGSVGGEAFVTGSFTSHDEIYPKKDGLERIFVDTKHTANATANVTVTVDLSVPTATTVPTMTPTMPSPILTGEVTYCDVATFTMNLRFDHSFVPSNFNHQVTINGEPMACKVNGSNSSLLLCSYPSSIVFPANIKVSINDIVVNDFMFDGAVCVIPATPTPEPKQPDCVPLPGKACP
jgi:hypothetical protein